MANSKSATASGYPLDKLIAAKGKGASVSVTKEQLIINEDTVETELTNSIITVPHDDKFLILVKPLAPLTNKQTVSVMSRFVLKSVKSAFVENSETNFRNGPRYSQEFMDKWNPSNSR